MSSLVNGTACIDESELLDELAKFSDEHNMVGHRIRRRHAQQLHRDLQQGPFDEGESGAEEPEVEMSAATDDKMQVPVVSNSGFTGQVFCDSVQEDRG